MKSYRLTEEQVVEYSVTDAKKSGIMIWSRYIADLDKFLARGLEELATLKKFWAVQDAKENKDE